MKKKIVCFGDSNTYGYDPRSWFGERYPAADRWPELLAERTRHEVVNLGSNGREVPHSLLGLKTAVSIIEKYRPVDLIITMLGSNDVCCGCDGDELEERLTGLIDLFTFSFPGTQQLLLLPADLGSASYREIYERLAAEKKIFFADASAWELPLCFDGIHLTEKANRLLAGRVAELVDHQIFRF